MKKALRKCKGNACNAFLLNSKANILTIFPHLKLISLNYLLFVVYGVVFCMLLMRSSFITNSGLNSRMILLLFMFKAIAGIAIGWLSLHFYNTGNDYWDVNREGWKEYQLLWSNPHDYFTNIFRSAYPNGYAGLFDSFQSFWNDLKNNLIIKLVSVFNIFSRGNYYINSLFFNFIVFFGHVALYRVFIKIYRGQTYRVIIGCFLLPSLLYFSSGIHKDGIVFLMLAILVYAVFMSLQKNKFNLKRIAIIAMALLILFLTRNFVCIALLPALTAWILSAKIKAPPLISFAVVYLLAGLLFFNFNSIFPAADPLKTIVEKQSDFLQLPHPSTAIQLDTLYPRFSSFMHNAPQSFNHLLMRPYLMELPSTILLPMNIELFIYQLLFIIFLFFHKRDQNINRDTFIPFAIFFTLTVFLFIGYIVPNLGSLIRYRSLYLPYIITPILCCIDLERLRALLKVKK